MARTWTKCTRPLAHVDSNIAMLNSAAGAAEAAKEFRAYSRLRRFELRSRRKRRRSFRMAELPNARDRAGKETGEHHLDFADAGQSARALPRRFSVASF